MRHFIKYSLLLLFLTTACVVEQNPNNADKQRAYSKTVTWQQIYVYDGDTIAIYNNTPQQKRVRIIGVDTPELSSKCRSGRILALQAKKFTQRALKNAKSIVLVNPPDVADQDRYRRLLRIVLVDNKDLAKLLIDAGLGRDYMGGYRASWCD